MVAKARREEARSWEAGCGRWKQADGTETHADPATRVDGVVVEGRRGWSHVKAPRSGTEGKSKVGESGATIKISGEVNEENKTRELELRR